MSNVSIASNKQVWVAFALVCAASFFSASARAQVVEIQPVGSKLSAFQFSIHNRTEKHIRVMVIGFDRDTKKSLTSAQFDQAPNEIDKGSRLLRGERLVVVYNFRTGDLMGASSIFVNGPTSIVIDPLPDNAAKAKAIVNPRD